MDLLTHIVFGFWMYKKYDLIWVVVLCCIFDIDHIMGYFYDRRKIQHWEIPKFYKFVYHPRTWFHSFTGLILMQALFSLFLPWRIVMMSLSSHLLMDVIDTNGISILPPIITEKVTGPLPVSYSV